MRKEGAAFDFYNKQQVSKYHNYTTIGQYSEISEGFFIVYTTRGLDGKARPAGLPTLIKQNKEEGAWKW